MLIMNLGGYVHKLHRHALKSKDVKKLSLEISERFGFKIEHFFESKFRVESCEIDEITAFLFNGKPLLAKSDKALFFTLFFEEIFSSFPKIVVDMGAVPFVCKGADVMAPGIQEIQGNFDQNGLILVIDERHGKPLAVGLALVDSEKMKNTAHGKTVKNLHYVGDKLWSSLKSH